MIWFSTYYDIKITTRLEILDVLERNRKTKVFFGLRFLLFEVKIRGFNFLPNLLLLRQWNKEQKKGKNRLFCKKKCFSFYSLLSLSQSNILFNFLALLGKMYKCCTLHKVEKFWQTNTDVQTLSFHLLVLRKFNF